MPHLGFDRSKARSSSKFKPGQRREMLPLRSSPQSHLALLQVIPEVHGIEASAEVQVSVCGKAADCTTIFAKV